MERGPVRDAVVLNAGAALAVYEHNEGVIEEQLRAGIAKAETALDEGGAVAVLERWIAAAQAVGTSQT